MFKKILFGIFAFCVGAFSVLLAFGRRLFKRGSPYNATEAGRAINEGLASDISEWRRRYNEIAERVRGRGLNEPHSGADDASSGGGRPD